MQTLGSYDVVIVGAGTAGCALAARLSENTNRSVLVIEAGHHFGPIESYPRELQLMGSFEGGFPGHPNNWSFVASLTSERTYPVVRGKVVGGSSAINGQQFARGLPYDYDCWAREGNTEWSFEKVLPTFKKLERDLDFGSDERYHGSDGPVLVSRVKQDAMTSASLAFEEACLDLGFPADPDKNHPDSIGIGPPPLTTQQGGIRLNTGVAYLEPNLRRSNLSLLSDAVVHRVLLSGNRAVGVELVYDNQKVRVDAGEVVLSAGALKSPQLLMLSGIGPADALQSLGISPVLDSPAVGANLQDHPVSRVSYKVDRQPPIGLDVPYAQMSLSYTSEESPSPGDLHLFPTTVSLRTAMGGSRFGPASLWRRPGQALKALRGLSPSFLLKEMKHQSDMTVLCALYAPLSRGRLTLLSSDPDVSPELRYNYLADPLDGRRMRECVRLAVDIVRSSTFQRDLGARLTEPGDDDLSSDAALDAWVLANLGTAQHTTSTCRMGTASDPAAVVDQYCRVHGIDALRVVDISVMPSIVSRGPYATAVMIAERAAEFVETGY